MNLTDPKYVEDVGRIWLTRIGDDVRLLAETVVGARFLANAASKLLAMQDTHFVPRVTEYYDGALHLEYIEAEPVTDEVAFRRNCARLLIALREHGIRHGDLTRKNIIVRDNIPVAIDFQQSKWLHEAGDKRPEGDAYHLWQAAEELSPDTSRHIRRWRAIREHLVGDIIDIGCAEGDFLLFYYAEAPHSRMIGIDKDPYALVEARKAHGEDAEILRWQKDIMADTELPYVPNKMMLSVFPYLFAENSNRATLLVKMCIRDAKRFFFETQLYGDGPGPKEFKTDDDVHKWLSQFGHAEAIVTVPVHGRPFSRTVWKVT